MIKNISTLLQIDNFYGCSENIDIAKGKNELTKNIKKTYKQKIRQWLKR